MSSAESIVKTNQTKAALLGGATVEIVEINRIFDPVVVELAAQAGFGCVWIDMEHSHLGLDGLSQANFGGAGHGGRYGGPHPQGAVQPSNQAAGIRGRRLGLAPLQERGRSAGFCADGQVPAAGLARLGLWPGFAIRYAGPHRVHGQGRCRDYTGCDDRRRRGRGGSRSDCRYRRNRPALRGAERLGAQLRRRARGNPPHRPRARAGGFHPCGGGLRGQRQGHGYGPSARASPCAA